MNLVMRSIPIYVQIVGNDIQSLFVAGTCENSPGCRLVEEVLPLNKAKGCLSRLYARIPLTSPAKYQSFSSTLDRRFSAGPDAANGIPPPNAPCRCSMKTLNVERLSLLNKPLARFIVHNQALV